MSGFTAAWIGWGLAFAVIEGIALFNSRRGDTLSEHVWTWLGVGRYSRTSTCLVCGHYVRTTSSNGGWFHSPGVPPVDPHPPVPGVVTPKWTLRVARLAVATLLVWLLGHFLTGGALW